MAYLITVKSDRYEWTKSDATAEQAMAVVMTLLDGAAAAHETETPATPPMKQKKGGRPKSDVTLTRDEEGPSIKAAPDRDAVKRLIKSSDLSPQDIAKKMGCAVGYVYMLRYAMKKAGELN